MSVKRTLVEIAHDEGYGEFLLLHMNSAFGGKDMRAERIVTIQESAPQDEEKPKQYRAFNDPAEAEALLGFPLRLKVDHKNKGVFIGITSHGFQIGLSHWKPKEAFDCFERLDGTPFGIEVTE